MLKADRERLISMYSTLVEQLGAMLPQNYEIALHDLERLPNSVVAISGNVTGRAVGDPATDLLLQQAVSGRFENRVGYETRLPDGRKLRSSTTIIFGLDETAIAALCINAELTAWEQVHSLVARMLPPSTRDEPSAPVRARDGEASSPEIFAHSVEELATHLIDQSLEDVGIPVSLMKKPHKVQVVRDLRERGFFMLAGAADLVASTLEVTRFTVYNYLRQLDEEAPEA